MDARSINHFLAQTLRLLRDGENAPWPGDALVGGQEVAPFDWPDVWARIEYHGIAMVLHGNAARLQEWPAQLIARIAEEARLVGLWETTHREVVVEVLARLAAAGIDSVIMKGTALAYTFHDDPADRRRGDTDLLVQPAMLGEVRAILGTLGWYRRQDPHGLTYQEGWQHRAAGFFEHSIDLHWEPSDRPALRTCLPREAFFGSTQPVPRLCEDARRPSTPVMIVHGAINQKWHREHGYYAQSGRVTGARRLIWSLDFDYMARAMSQAQWAELAANCSASGIGPIVAEALRGAECDLGTRLPQDVMDQLEAAPLSTDLKTIFTPGDGLGQFWLDLRTARGMGERVMLLRERAFPPRRHLVDKYPQAKGWPTILLQLRLLIETAGRVVRRAVS